MDRLVAPNRAQGHVGHLPALTGKNGEILIGPTVGGSIEWAFSDNWSLRGEYLYANYGRQTVAHPNGTVFRADFETHTARIALNYKFPYK
jgi:outer membrane immunogenic protein